MPTEGILSTTIPGLTEHMRACDAASPQNPAFARKQRIVTRTRVCVSACTHAHRAASCTCTGHFLRPSALKKSSDFVVFL